MTQQNQTSWFAEWFGIALIAVGLIITGTCVATDLTNQYVYLALGFRGEAEFEVIGALIAIFGFVIDVLRNHI